MVETEKMKLLRQAIENLDPRQPLDGELLEKFYVSRSDRTIKQLQLPLTFERPAKILFTGMIGSGKSTELNRLVSEFKNEFEFIKPKVENDLEIYLLKIEQLMLYLLWCLLQKMGLERGGAENQVRLEIDKFLCSRGSGEVPGS
jgi:predicted GTPase